MKVVLVFAHPDDETFTSSGTIINLTQKGHTAKLIMATKGEAGMLGNPPVATKKTLGKIRERELKKAAKVTGISQIYFLDYLDGTLDTIHVEEIEKRITSILKKEKPDLVITFEKNGISMHPDHKVISKATTLGFKKYMSSVNKRVQLYHVCLPITYLKIHHAAGYKYEYFGKMIGTPDDNITTRVDVTKIYPLKEKAMRSHVTQGKDCENLLKRNQLIPGKKYEHFQLIAENKPGENYL